MLNHYNQLSSIPTSNLLYNKNDMTKCKLWQNLLKLAGFLTKRLETLLTLVADFYKYVTHRQVNHWNIENPKHSYLPFLGGASSKNICLSVCLSTYLPVIEQCRPSPYDVAKIHLTAPMDFWWNSTPFFGSMEDDLLRKTTFDGRWPLMGDDLSPS